MKPRYRQLVESPEYKEGALWEQVGNEPITALSTFECIDHEAYCKFPEHYATKHWVHNAYVVTQQPHLFEKITPVYLNEKQMKKFKTLV